MKVFPLFYFGPIPYFRELIKADDWRLERMENLPKQTYRNRCEILGANGKLRLTIPLLHDGSRCLKDIKISYEEDWQKIHWRSLIASYKSSPYFEYYEDELIQLYQKKEKYLLDFNLNGFQWIMGKMGMEKEIIFTTSYQDMKAVKSKDFRDKFPSKKEMDYNYKSYSQVFEENLPFVPHLSILDLFFFFGPRTVSFLNND